MNFQASLADILAQNNSVLTSGEIRGSKWNDLDKDRVRDAEEPGLSGWTIYLDSNENDQLDEGEVSTVTDADGNYAFTGLSSGTYTVTEVLQNGWVQTFPGFGGGIIQLTDNDFNDEFPQISGNQVVWYVYDGNDSEIYYYDGSSVTQLTDNDFYDYNPQISGNQVVWYGYDGNDTEIYYYDGSSVTQLTDNNFNDDFPQISGNNVVWEGYDGNDTEIYYYDGSSIIQLTDNDIEDYTVQISGNKVVWQVYDGNNSEIYYYDGSSIIQLTDNTSDNYDPQISGNNVVWSGNDGNDWEIYYYDGSSIIQLTDNNFNDQFPQISGNNVVWEGYDGSDSEIYYYNGSSITQLTDNTSDNYYPQISGNNVVWQGSDGSDYEIYYYNGSSVINLSDNNFYDSDPQISGNNVVWQGYDGNDLEIFVTSVGTVSHTVELANGEIVEGIDFGNQEILPGEIRGVKWNDLDGDAVRDEGEPGLFGWTIFLDADNDGVLDEGETSTTTDVDGNYAFTGLEPGTYTVAEVLQDGWLPTFPDSTHTVEVSYNQVIQDINFGNQILMPGEIRGSKWNDLDKDRVRDAEETGLSGWTIYLDSNENGQLDEGEVSTTTDADGNYAFTGLNPGTYTVTEVQQAGWVQTYPNSTHTVKVNYNQVIQDINFGNQVIIPGEIRGSKWNDLDGDRVRDAEETGLSGWTIYLDSNENGQLDEGEVSTTTDADGNYAFTGLNPGTYTVTEVQQAGWVQTYPGFGSGITQLTNNNIHDYYPLISGNNVVWWRYDGNGFEIYYNGSSITQLTDNNFDDDYLQISGNNVVWQVEAGYDFEIYYYDGGSITQLTDKDFYDYDPQISGNQVVWRRYDGNDSEIYYYDGSSITQLTDNGFYNLYPQISGNNVVWQVYDGNDSEIYYYDGSSITQLTDNGFNDEFPQISGNQVVWSGIEGNDREIYYYDGSSIIQLTDNNTYDYNPQISGNNVVWEGYDGNDFEIYYYNGSSITQLTDNNTDDSPQISGNNVVWEGYDGNDFEIYYYDGSSVIQLTDNNTYDYSPQISGNTVVWSGYDGNDSEIFVTSVGTVSHSVQLANGEIVEGIDFGNQFLLPGEIHGIKWNDLDGDEVRDEGEPGLADWTIFLDVDSDGILDENETSTTTDVDGNYVFTGLEPGTYKVAEVLQEGWFQTFPNSTHTVKVNYNQVIQDINFGNQILMPGEIRGSKWYDIDGDGVQDEGEPGLADWTIFLDTDNDGVLDEGETSTITDTNGNYTLTNVNPGTQTVAELLQAGWEPTYSDFDSLDNNQTVRVGNGEIVEGIDFGNRLSVQTINGTAGDDNLTGRTPGRDIINGGNGQDTLVGGGDADTLNGNKGRDTLIGGTGNDQLNGNQNDDILIGVDPDSTLAGRSEIDTFIDNLGNDTIVLGDTQKAYYDDGQAASAGLADYGNIIGFKTNGDVIQLHGSAEQYLLSSSPFGGSRDTAIYLQTEGTYELIGLVKEIQLSALTLNSASFSFV